MERETRILLDSEQFSNLPESDIEQILEINERKEDLDYGVAFTVMEYADRIGDEPFTDQILETKLGQYYEELQSEYPEVENGHLHALWRTATRNYRNSVETTI